MHHQLPIKRQSTFPIAFASIFSAIIATICTIDAAMGEAAEYFNAWVIVVKLTRWLHGQQPPTEKFLYGQDQLGPWALPVAALLLFGSAALLAGLIVTVGRLCRNKIS